MTDFIVVGGGSAGAVIASRLSEDERVEVLLLEAGPVRPPRESLVPAGFSRLFESRYDWGFRTEPEPALGGRGLFWPRGRLLGGSSAMNAMIWTRGARADFDRWAALGNRGWSYSDLGPRFDRSELVERRPRPGRVGVSVSRPRSANPLSHRFVEALTDLGVPPNDGFGAGNLDGVGLFRVSQHRGERCSTATGYLAPVAHRKNLEITGDAVVQRIEFAGRRAVGVRYHAGGQPRQARGRVILAAGAIGSPHLLQLSGVGPADLLHTMGVPVVQDLPGVGANLQDHLAIASMHRLDRPLSLATAGRADHVLRYLLARRGPLTSNVAEAGAFLRLEGGPLPDLELLFAPTYFVDHGRGNPPGHGFTIAAILLHPAGRGTIRLRSANPDVPPAIAPNYLTTAGDLRMMVEGVELSRRVAAHEAFAPYRGPEFLPGAGRDLTRFVRDRAETLYHPVGTCTMGTGTDAVVSDRLRVHGLDDLWVADASIIPRIPSGHPNAVVVMIGEMAAELVRS